MRGIGSTFSRLPKAAAWLAGAAILAGAMTPKAFAQSEETAMAIPRLAPFDGEGVALPRPLAAPDAALLRRLFADTRSDAPTLLRQAAALDPTIRLNDDMLGHLLAARYLSHQRRPSVPELAAWLARHAALPDAPAIAALLHRRDPAAAVALAAAPPTPAPVPEEAEPPGRSFKRNPLLDATVRQRLHDTHFDSALRLIAHTKGLTATYGATLRAEVAQALFTHNRDAAALALAQDAARQSASQVALPDYIAGLAAWRLGEHDVAMTHFAAAAIAPIAPPALQAAAAFWTARTCLLRHDLPKYHAWLAYAGTQRRTFYGQLARHLSGRADGLAFAHEVLGEAELDAVAAEPAGLRAFALLQIDQTSRAEAELRQLAAAVPSRPALARPIMLVAERAGFYDLAADLAATMQGQGGPALDSDRFPIPRLRPRHGFTMDPSLVYALARIESNFDTTAVSAMGAEGLMQIMPVTASYVVNGQGHTPHLHDPAINLDLGQRYVAYLAGHDIVDGDLIRLLASYNSGPGGFARWSADIRDNDDPLMFIEAIPNNETRAFVQRALAYSWIYAARLHLPSPSLDTLALGQFPRFSAATDQKMRVLH